MLRMEDEAAGAHWHAKSVEAHPMAEAAELRHEDPQGGRAAARDWQAACAETTDAMERTTAAVNFMLAVGLFGGVFIIW